MIKVVSPIAVLGITALLTVTPATAEEDMGKGFNLIEEGARIILRGLVEEMGPALEELQGMAGNMGPVIEELQAMIGDISLYRMPELLPNGDIIIRRRSPTEPGLPPSSPQPGDEIDL
ncbi:MAG: hypothetical protein ACC631_02125 [Halocynthiibacter sp.]